MKIYKKITLELNSTNAYEIIEVHRGDKNSRFIECSLTNDGKVIELSDSLTVIYDATVNGIIVANGISGTVNTEENTVIIELTENMLSLPGILKIDLKLTENNSLVTAQTFRVKVGESVINEDSKFEPQGGTIKDIMDEVIAARGDHENLKAVLESKSNKTDTDEQISDLQDGLSTKADKKYTDEQLACKYNYKDLGYISEFNSINDYNTIYMGRISGNCSVFGYPDDTTFQPGFIAVRIPYKGDGTDGFCSLWILEDGAVWLNEEGSLTRLGYVPDKSVTASKIADLSIKPDHISDELWDYLGDTFLDKSNPSVNSENIVNGAVTTPKIADGAITTAKLSEDLIKFLAKTESTENKVTEFYSNFTDGSNSKYPTVSAVMNYLSAYYYDYFTSDGIFESIRSDENGNLYVTLPDEDEKLLVKNTALALAKDVDDVKAFLGYTDENIVGLQVDYQNRLFNRLAGAVNKTSGADFDIFEMYGGRKRCNVADDGTITAYYGDENYSEDGSNGQVMVYQPKFYYRVVPLRLDKNTETNIGYHLRKANYYVSDKPFPGFKLHPAFYDENGKEIDYILFSAYEGSMYDVSAEEYVNDGTNTDTTIETGDLLCSIANVKPISGAKKPLNKANLEIMASNHGSGWHLSTIKAESANQLLMMIELGTMNTQSAIGQGVVSITDNSSYNCSSLTGSTSQLGNGTGQATETVNEIAGVETVYNESGKVSVSYRGVENPWGNIWKHIDGVNIWGDGSMGGGQPYVASDFIFSESKHDGNYESVGFTVPNSNGYINAMGYGLEKFDWLLMPSEIGGTSALPVGDYCQVTSDLNDYTIIRLGGVWNGTIPAGGFCWYFNSGASSRSKNVGGRLIYVPTAKE